MKKTVIFGAGGHGHSVYELIMSLNGDTRVEFWDDQPKSDQLFGCDVLRATNSASKGTMCLAVGNNKHRQKLAERYSNYSFPTYIHSSSTVYPSSSIGQGTVIFPQAVIDASVSIGNFCIINNQATISHNVLVGDFTHIAIQSAISGGVTIKEGALIGAGSVVLPGITIGKWAIVGAGAVVTKDVPDFSVVYGNPARVQTNTMQ